MAEYTDAAGAVFELPKMTLALSETLEAANDAAKPRRERVAVQMKLCRECLGADYTAQRCGGKTAESVDVIALEILCGELRDAYYGESDEIAAERVLRRLESFAPVIKAVEAVSSFEAPQKSRQGFTRVL